MLMDQPMHGAPLRPCVHATLYQLNAMPRYSPYDLAAELACGHLRLAMTMPKTPLSHLAHSNPSPSPFCSCSPVILAMTQRGGS